MLHNAIIKELNISETSLIRTLKRLENVVLNREVSLLEGFILTEITTLVTESALLIRGVSCLEGCFTISI